MRLTKKKDNRYVSNLDYSLSKSIIKKLGQLEDIEEELGIDLLTFLKGVDPDTCFMEITKDKQFDFCGDAYHGRYTKKELLELIQNLLFMYWALTKGGSTDEK